MGGWERELSWRSIQGWRHRVVITCCSRSVSCPGYLLWSVRPTLGHSQTLQSYAEMGKPYPSPASIFISKRKCWRNSLDVVGCKKIDRWRPLTSAAFVLILSNCMWHLHTDIILLNNFEKKKKEARCPRFAALFMLIALLKIDTFTQIARNLLSDLGIEILSHFFLHYVSLGSYLSNSVSLGAVCCLICSPHLRVVSFKVSLSHRVLLRLKSDLFIAFLLYF